MKTNNELVNEATYSKTIYSHGAFGEPESDEREYINTDKLISLTATECLYIVNEILAKVSSKEERDVLREVKTGIFDRFCR